MSKKKIERAEEDSGKNMESRDEQYPDIDSFELNLPNLEDMTEIVRMTQDIQRQLQPLLDSMRPMMNWMDQIRDTVEGFQRMVEAREAIGQGIKEIPPPNEYEEGDIEIREDALALAENSVDRLIYSIDEFPESVPDQMDYSFRLSKGLEAYRNKDYLLATFVFMSVQDGIMDIICQIKEVKPEGFKGNYSSSQKRENLAEDFTELIEIEEKDVEDKAENFWKHRCAVMHGDPGAHINQEISEISLIFLEATVATLFQILEEQEESEILS